MGTIRNRACEQMDEELRRVSPATAEIETRKDEYSEDYIVWVTVNGEIHAIRITTEEYAEGVWVANVLQAMEALAGGS